ncbi:MAG: arsenic resistance N-acetyltransferase ArsN2 [Gemmatimonadaceae bacterium]|nr:arsenic resistance N-acetyltransferase ArsN2 [Gemmatimonadaceae bacterium]
MSLRVLRVATDADRSAVEELLRANALPVDGLDRAWPNLVVASDGGVLVGAAGFERYGSAALLRSVVVHEQARRSGLGEAMVRDRIGAAVASGVEDLVLLTTTAAPFFARLGFEERTRDDVPAAVRASVEFTTACPDTATVMHRDLRVPSAPWRVLVLCTGNSARSQIGEALLAVRGAGRFAAASAGSRPAARVNPYAIETLAAHGIAWEGREPKTLDAVEGVAYDLVITVCDNAKEACPYYPGARAMVHWGLPDPADETEPAAARAAFAWTYDAIARRVDALRALPVERLAPAELKELAGRIHSLATE